MPDCTAFNAIVQVRSSWALGLVLLTACDPIVKISGHGAGGAAKVFLECPDAQVSIIREVVADRDGRFVFGGLGCLPKTCRVRSGEVSVEVRAACVHTTRGCASDTCTEAKVELVGQ
jgi:hypothetical protein